MVWRFSPDDICEFRQLKIGNVIRFDDSQDGRATVVEIMETCIGGIPPKDQTVAAEVSWTNYKGQAEKRWVFCEEDINSAAWELKHYPREFSEYQDYMEGREDQ